MSTYLDGGTGSVHYVVLRAQYDGLKWTETGESQRYELLLHAMGGPAHAPPRTATWLCRGKQIARASALRMGANLHGRIVHARAGAEAESPSDVVIHENHYAA